MSGDRENLHRLVDELDEQRLDEAAALLRRLQPTTSVPTQPRRRLDFVGAYDSGRTNTAARSAEILREELGSKEPHGR